MKALILLLAGLATAPQPQESSTTVSGTVSLKAGVILKKRKPLKIDACAHCAPLYPAGMPREELVLDPENRIKGAFVYVKSGLEGRKFVLPKMPVLLDQKGCRYEPRVVGLMAGQELAIRNSDPHSHCIHGLAFLNREFHIGQPKGCPDITRTFDRAETMIKIRDEVYPWMAAWVGVVDHPFFAVTDETGKFEIRGLPPGRYTLEVWQESLKSVTQEIEVKQNESKTANFHLELR